MAPMRILLVEDDTFIQKAYSFQLEKEGFEVSVAKNGKEALEMIKKDRPALLLLDLMMPIMSGFEVLKELGGEPEAPPIIVLSNLGEKGDKEECERLGAKAFLVKTNTAFPQLFEAIQKALRSGENKK